MPGDGISGRDVQDNYMNEITLWEEFNIGNFQKVFIESVVAESNRLLVLRHLKRVLELGLRRGNSSLFEEGSQDAAVPPSDSNGKTSVKSRRGTGGHQKGTGRGSKKSGDPKKQSGCRHRVITERRAHRDI